MGSAEDEGHKNSCGSENFLHINKTKHMQEQVKCEVISFGDNSGNNGQEVTAEVMKSDPK